MIPGTNYDLTILSNNPSGYWRLDETSGATANDSSGNNANGSYVGAVTLGATPGPIYNESGTGAVSLPGGTASVGVSLQNPGATSGASYSIETWVYPILASTYMTIWGFDGSCRLLVSSSGRLLSQFQGNYFSASTLTGNTWHHVVYEYDASTQKASYYINGALDSTYATTISNAAGAFNSAYYLGQYDTSSNYKWHGKIGQHAFYKYVLSAAQIAHDYQVGAGVSPSPTPTPLPSPVTGINHWWTYEEDALGGVGRYMVNVANGNLIVQSDDMAIPNKGIELAFRRTYNSMSQHDFAGTDGSTPSNYGNGWTNTFDAHLAYYGALGILSVYDIDGARYDYTSNGTGCWVPPVGQFATLCSDGANGYFWTKKKGVYYYFYSPVQTNNNAGFAGRPYEICGRNHNNFLAFHGSGSPLACFTTTPPSTAGYYFDSSATSAANLNKVIVGAEDGRIATLQFGAGSGGQRLLSSLTWPDGTQVTYGYDNLARLIQVTKPGNNVASTLSEGYQYSGSGYLLESVLSPRWLYSNGSSGGWVGFSFLGNQATQVSYNGWINPTITDAAGKGPLQSAYASNYGVTSPYRTITLTYSNPPSPPAGAPPCTATGSTTWKDTDGHKSVYCWDSLSRVVQTSNLSGDPSPGPAFLTTTQGWDASNNLIFSTDARANRTDYAYDANGNTFAVAQPAPAAGAFRSTAFYSYDQNNNLTAYCDPVAVHNAQKDWIATPAPSDSLCSSSNGISQFASYTWTSPASGAEPQGELTGVTTPLGYGVTFNYDATSQSGLDYGLPTKLLGTTFTQGDGTSTTPEQDFRYDTAGNLVCYSKDGTAWTVLQYDNNLTSGPGSHLGRVTGIADPDDASLTSSLCSTKTAGLAGSSIVTRESYYPDGEVASVQSPAEAAMGVSSQFTYDADGDEVSESHYYSDTTASPAPAGVTQKWYDGSDRLVEVQLPHDSTDLYSVSWITRYIYDLTQGGTQGTLTLDGVTGVLAAYGNLFEKQEFLNSGTSWLAIRGWVYDALDRSTRSYWYWDNDVPRQSSSVYDTAPGLLGSMTNEVGDTKTLTYDAIGRVTEVDYAVSSGSVATPTEKFGYDADGRTTSAYSPAFGTQYYGYDAAGHMISSTEPQGGSGVAGFPGSGALTSPATLTYQYYANGWRKNLTVASSALNQSNLLTYDYSADGHLSKEIYTRGTVNTFGINYTLGDRILSTTDPLLNPATTRTYDGYGRLASYAIDAGKYSGLTYDAEGDTVAVTTTVGSNTSSFSHKYNNRGELVDYVQSANGYPYDPSYPTNQVQIPSATYSFARRYDTRNSANEGYQHLVQPFSTPLPACTSPLYYSWTESVGYDAAGRQTNDNGLTSGQYNDRCHTPPPTAGLNVDSYSDAENHLVGEDTVHQTGGISTDERSVRYGWGPNGHPIILGTTVYATPVPTPPPAYYHHTLHWDGDSVLFSTNGSGQLEDVKIGTVADDLPLDTGYSGLTTWDRDISAQIVSAHTALGHDHWIYPANNPNNTPCQDYTNLAAPTSGYRDQATFPLVAGVGEACNNWYPTGVVYTNTLNGYGDGLNIHHGPRSSGASSWKAPDPFGGVVHDPMSQKPYIYDRNNSVEYADPSGFLPIPPGGGFNATNVEGMASRENGLSSLALNNSNNMPDLPVLNGHYATASEAAEAFAEAYEDKSIECNCEWGATIYKGSYGYGYYDPHRGAKCTNGSCHVDVDPKDRPALTSFEGTVHTHPGVRGKTSESQIALDFANHEEVADSYKGKPLFWSESNGNVYKMWLVRSSPGGLLNDYGFKAVCFGCAIGGTP